MNECGYIGYTPFDKKLAGDANNPLIIKYRDYKYEVVGVGKSRYDIPVTETTKIDNFVANYKRDRAIQLNKGVCGRNKTLSELSPGAKSQIIEAIANYITNNPEKARPYLEKPVNDNEWADSPFERPDLDTDADGYTDGDEAGSGSNPDDPDSVPEKPSDKDGDGVPDKDDDDDDNDGIPDKDDSAPNDPDSGGPDSDGDGKSDAVDTDDDNDGIPDSKDDDDDDDGIPDDCEDAENPEECAAADDDDGDKPCEEGQEKGENGECAPPKDDGCPEGEEKGEDGECAAPPDDGECPEGQEKGKDGKCAPPPPGSSPPDDSCGTFSYKRLLAYPGSFVKDLFVPCAPVKEMFTPLIAVAKTKFPFSVAMNLRGWFHVGGGGGGNGSDLPDSIGPIPLTWTFLTPLWTTIKTLVGVALYAAFGYWLLDRFTPRTQI
ncbi:thrombospondin type 3 repeat-containing protein [Deinococcus lacus]|uniref:Thrombospondin type 3 repeat-containing protein n=4 Tax=Deinococcus lacus TaxID=392561 RepID=A0ABW1YFN8_9DEIO